MEKRIMKYLYIQTFGCQMNFHDSDQMATLLERSGYRTTDDLATSDLVIINTCSVREKAEQKAHSFIGRLVKLKRKRRVIIGIAGCLAQQWGKEFLIRNSHLDFVLGTHNIHRLPEIVEEIEKSGTRTAETSFHERVKSLEIYTPSRNGHVTSCVTIMQGCNNFCSFCIVPHLRGREESRPSGHIVDEIRRLAASGIREVMLLGQNVNSYGNTLADSPGFPELLAMINDIEGVERIRFTTSHPKDLSEDLMKCFGSLEKLCEHIHLPVQSGSDRILAQMNRRYTSEEYLEKVRTLRAYCPGISISSDIIVGFPGEEEEDFQKTIDLMEKVIFDTSFSFKYSARPGIVAQEFEGRVDEKTKSRRLSLLQAVQERHTLQVHRSLVGGIVDVLVESVSRNDASEITGRSRSHKIVNFPGDSSSIGRIVPVRITAAFAHSLRGGRESGREVTQC